MAESHPSPEAAYLINLAEALQKFVLPSLEGEARGRAEDCMVVALRVAVAIDGDCSMDTDTGSRLSSEARFRVASQQRFLDLFKAVTSSRPEFSRNLDAVRISRALQSHPRGGRGLSIRQARLLPGGRSKLTTVVEQDGAVELPRDLVIRQDWMTLAGSSVCSEFGLLEKLWGNGIRLPQPFILESDAEVLGAPFMVVARSAGKQNGDILTPPQDPTVVLEAAEELGRIHALGDTPFAGLPGIAERNFTQDQLRASLQGFRCVIDQFQHPESAVLIAALDWLDCNVTEVSGYRALVHGDYGFHNLLFDGPHLTAVLDWELTHLGNPAYDLGYLRGVVEQTVDWDAFVRRYRNAGGPEVDAFTVDWFALFTGIWLYHILLQARAGVVTGAVHDIEIVTVCANIGPPLLLQIGRILRRVVAAPVHA